MRYRIALISHDMAIFNDPVNIQWAMLGVNQEPFDTDNRETAELLAGKENGHWQGTDRIKRIALVVPYLEQ